MSATADLNAAVCGGLAAALLDACGGESDTAREWVAGAYAPSWGEVAAALDDLRAAREHLTRMITEATPCEGCGSPAGIGCAFDCDPAGAGTCDTCGAPYDAGSRDGRCGDCGECAAHCDHKAGAWVSDKAGAWSHCGKVATPQREGAGTIAVCATCGDVAVIDCGAP